MRMTNCAHTTLPLLEKLFCFLVVWGSGTCFTLSFSYVYYAIAFTFALIVLSGGFHLERNMHKPILGICFFTLLSIYLNLQFMGGGGISSTVNNYVIILCSILFAMNKSYLNKERINYIIKVFLFFSFLTSFLYIIYSLGALPVRLVHEESHIYTFYYLLNVAQSDVVDSVFRNGGIYWEPGMYQVFLVFVLIYYLFNKQLKQKKSIIVYLVFIIVSTISVSGYVLTLLVFGIYAISNPNGNKLLKSITRVAVIAALAFLLPVVTGLLTAKQETGSFDKRSLDLVLAWEVFLQHPILGQGIVNNAYEKAYFELIGEERPSSNGLMNLLMGLGVLGTAVYFYCYTRTLKFFSKEYSKLLFTPLLLWLLVSINTEPIQYQPFIHFLFGAGFAYCYERGPLVRMQRA